MSDKDFISKDYEWHRSSYCASGACVQVSLSDNGHVLVRDSKLGDDSPVLVLTSGGWSRVLDDIHTYGVPDGASWVRRSGVLWGSFRFTYDEWDAFTQGVYAGEFDYDKLSSGEAGSGFRGVARSGHAATGAGAIAVPPVPVAAHQWECTHQAGCPVHGDVRDCEPVPVVAQHFELEARPLIPQDAWDPQCVCGQAWPCSGDRTAIAVPPVPVAAQPRYVLDAPAILELVERYGEAERDAADSFMRPAQKMSARDEADNLLRAIRVALTPVPDVEPEPNLSGEPGDKACVLFDHHLDMEVWYRDDAVAAEARASSGSHVDERWFKVGDYDGDPLCWENVLAANPDVRPVLLERGPLVEHNPSSDAEPYYPAAGICRCGADGHGPGDNLCVCRSAS